MEIKKYGYVENGNIVYAPKIFKVRVPVQSTNIDYSTGEGPGHETYREYIEQHPELHPESYALAYPNPFYEIEDNLPTCDEYHKVVHKTWTFDEDRKVCVHEYEIIDRQFTQDDYDKAMEAHIRQTRIARGYTLREPSAYVDSKVPRFKQDSEDWQNFMDAVMLYALDILNKVAAGQPAPTLKEFKENLPICQWTEV